MEIPIHEGWTTKWTSVVEDNLEKLTVKNNSFLSITKETGIWNKNV